jgi:hypothetical protein
MKTTGYCPEIGGAIEIPDAKIIQIGDELCRVSEGECAVKLNAGTAIWNREKPVTMATM